MTRTPDYIVTTTQPNGMIIEEQLEPNGQECLGCSGPAVTLKLSDGILERFCVVCLQKIIDKVKEVRGVK